MTHEKILSEYIEEAALAAEFDVSTRTIRRYRNLPNGLPHVRLGGRILYHVDAVRKWIKALERHPNRRIGA